MSAVRDRDRLASRKHPAGGRRDAAACRAAARLPDHRFQKFERGRLTITGFVACDISGIYRVSVTFFKFLVLELGLER
jgi:hypothetical protein